MTARRALIMVFSLFVALSCVWVPWKTPTITYAPTDTEGIRPRADTTGATVHLGYGWIWIGPKILQGSYAPSPEDLANFEKLGRIKARENAHRGFREPTETELEAGASLESSLWSARMNAPRTFYRNHAKPDVLRILLALVAGAAVCAVLYLAIPRKGT
jgi:hypothetical protein